LYTLRRLREDDAGKEAELALHFDLTVPLARYVAQHHAQLTFPFRRYCLQKVWRGERPQKGRYREFAQFDIDIIARDSLPLCCDAEVLTVFCKAFREMNVVKFLMRLNNRKVLAGLYESLGIPSEKSPEIIRVVDKLNKIGPSGVAQELTSVVGIASEQAEQILEWATKSCSATDVAAFLESLGVTAPLFQEGARDLVGIVALIPADLRPYIQIDLSLARGLDYYTGIIFEVVLPDHPAFGSVAAGGRYEDLAEHFLKGHSLPAVGGSFGLGRFMGLVADAQLVKPTKQCPTDILFSMYSDASLEGLVRLADRVRALGANAEVYYRPAKLGKQIEYAVAKGIRYIGFVDEETGALSVKDLDTKEQILVDDLDGWVRGHLL
jgi:histidyl-tRNA synthetase